MEKEKGERVGPIVSVPHRIFYVDISTEVECVSRRLISAVVRGLTECVCHRLHVDGDRFESTHMRALHSGCRGRLRHCAAHVTQHVAESGVTLPNTTCYQWINDSVER